MEDAVVGVKTSSMEGARGVVVGAAVAAARNAVVFLGDEDDSEKDGYRSRSFGSNGRTASARVDGR